MKYITRLTDTTQIKLMVGALQKVFSSNPNVKFELDYINAKYVKVTKKGLIRPLYMALCKENNTWVTSCPDDLFL